MIALSFLRTYSRKAEPENILVTKKMKQLIIKILHKEIRKSTAVKDYQRGSALLIRPSCKNCGKKYNSRKFSAIRMHESRCKSGLQENGV